MSFNLIDLVKDQLSDQIIGQLGNVIGGDSGQNESALGSAIPAILSGITNIGGTNSGAGALFDAFDKQDDSILDNLGDLLGGNNQRSMMDSGSNILGSLLGNGGLGTLVSAISGFSGAGKSGTKGLLSLLAPIIFSVVKRKLLGSGGSGFDIGSLMGLLNGQKDNVSAAMPTGFAKQLDSSGFNSIGSRFKDNVTETAQTTAKEGKSLISKLLPIALLIGAGLFAYNLFFKGASTPETTNGNVATDQINLNDGGANIADLSRNVKGTMDTVMTSLGSITDVSSAKAAIPSLTSATSQLSGLAGLMNKLPADARSQVSGLVSGGIPQLQEIINKVSAIPGVGPVIKPVVENLASKLTLFK